MRLSPPCILANSMRHRRNVGSSSGSLLGWMSLHVRVSNWIAPVSRGRDRRLWTSLAPVSKFAGMADEGPRPLGSVML